MPHPSHSSRFYHPSNIGWGVQIFHLLIMQSFDPISAFFLMSKIPFCSHCLTVPDWLHSPYRQTTLIVKYVAQIVTGEDDGRRYRQSQWASMREMTFAYQVTAINHCKWNDYIAYEISTCSSAIFRGSKLQRCASTNTTFYHFVNVVPKLLCWYLETFVETCRNFTCMYVCVCVCVICSRFIFVLWLL